MAAQAIRRRHKHTEIDGIRNEEGATSEQDSLSEPLLGTYNRSQDKCEQDGPKDENREDVHWINLFPCVIAKWMQWLGKIISRCGTFLGMHLALPCLNQNGWGNKKFPLSLSPLQEERLSKLKQRLEVPFDRTRMEHQDALKQLWILAYPNRELPPPKSELWKEMGWQGTDPSTDFRAGGFISLENLIFFAKNYPDAFQRLLHKRDGIRAEWEYPFALAGIHLSFMLAQMLNLQSGNPTTTAGVRFLHFLGIDEMAFDNLYCVAFQMLDSRWLAMHASYMEFNDVLKSTRKQLEEELSSDSISRVEDMPAYRRLST